MRHAHYAYLLDYVLYERKTNVWFSTLLYAPATVYRKNKKNMTCRLYRPHYFAINHYSTSLRWHAQGDILLVPLVIRFCYVRY